MMNLSQVGSSPQILLKQLKSNIPIALLFLLGIALGVIVAYLLVSGSWHLALMLVFIIPAALVIHRYPFISVLIWLVVTPFFLNSPDAASRIVYWAIHRALPLATVGVIVMSRLLGSHDRKLPRLALPELAMLLYVVVSIISIILLNATPKATFYLFYDRTISPLGLYLLVRLSSPREKDLQRIVPIAVFIIITQVTIGLTSWFAPQLLRPEWQDLVGIRTVGSLRAPAIFTTTLIFAGMFVFQKIANSKGIGQLFLFGVYMYSLLGVFFSFSRASWMAGIAAGVGLLTLYPKIMFRVILIAFPMMVFLAAGPMATQMEWADERLNSQKSEQTANSRLPVALAAVRMFSVKPFFGWGYANFDTYDRQFQGRINNFVGTKDQASHHAYLTILAEQGLVGFILYVLPFFYWLNLTFKAIPKIPNTGFWNKKLLIMFWLVMLGFVIVNNFGNMRVVFGLGIWWLTLGMIANMAYPYLEPEDVAPAPMATSIAKL